MPSSVGRRAIGIGGGASACRGSLRGFLAPGGGSGGDAVRSFVPPGGGRAALRAILGPGRGSVVVIGVGGAIGVARLAVDELVARCEWVDAHAHVLAHGVNELVSEV
jgi:hypothetical protein